LRQPDFRSACIKNEIGFRIVPLKHNDAAIDHRAMGFNRRKLEDERRNAGSKEGIRAPTIFSPTIGAAVRAVCYFLWVRCPACRMVSAIDLHLLSAVLHADRTHHLPSLCE
jgi:hypothetical protein